MPVSLSHRHRRGFRGGGAGAGLTHFSRLCRLFLFFLGFGPSFAEVVPHAGPRVLPVEVVVEGLVLQGDLPPAKPALAARKPLARIPQKFVAFACLGKSAFLFVSPLNTEIFLRTFAVNLFRVDLQAPQAGNCPGTPRAFYADLRQGVAVFLGDRDRGSVPLSSRCIRPAKRLSHRSLDFGVAPA